jgi:hypothetical protein
MWKVLACCGLDCGECDLKNLIHDDMAAERAVEWFKDRGWLSSTEGLDDAVQKGMYCKGCTGNRDIHWSPDCEILVCCVDDKKLKNCAQCALFPCELLLERASDSERYRKALEKLKQM